MQEQLKIQDEGNLNLINQLQSSYWHDRFDALNQIMLKNDAQLIFLAGQSIEKLNDESLVVSFIKTSKLNIENERMDICSIVLYFQFFFHHSKIEKIKVECERNIDLFFSTLNLVGAYKIECLRICFKMLPENRKIFITKVIGARKLKALTPLLTENFYSKDEKLMLATLRSCIFLHSTTNKIHIRKLLLDYIPKNNEPMEDEDLICQLILTLGYIGSWNDQFLIKKFFVANSKNVLMYSHRAYRVLLNEKSVKVLSKEFLSQQDVLVKQNIIMQLGKIDHGKSANELLNLFIHSKKLETQKQLSWAFHEISNKNKIPKLIETFLNSGDKIRFKLMKFFNEIFDWECYTFLNKIIHGKYNRFITMAAIEYISIYNKQETLDYIKSKFSDHNDPLAYYYLASILNHKIPNLLEYIIELIQKKTYENLMIYSLLLNKILEMKDLSINEPIIYDFVLASLKRDQGTISLIGFKISQYIHNVEIFTYLYQCFEKGSFTNPNITMQQLGGLIVYLTQHFPIYIKEHPAIIFNSAIIELIRDRDLTNEFIQFVLDLEDVQEAIAPYLKKFENKFTPALVSKILSSEDFKFLYNILPLLKSSKMILQDNILQFITKVIYPKSPFEIQNIILEIILNQHNNDYLDFLLHSCIPYSKNNLRGELLKYINDYINSP